MTLSVNNALTAGQIAAQIQAIQAALAAITIANTTIPGGIITGIDFTGSGTSMNLIGGIQLTNAQSLSFLTTVSGALNSLLTSQQAALAAVPFS